HVRPEHDLPALEGKGPVGDPGEPADRRRPDRCPRPRGQGLDSCPGRVRPCSSHRRARTGGVVTPGPSREAATTAGGLAGFYERLTFSACEPDEPPPSSGS